jgi:hypothetical protein
MKLLHALAVALLVVLAGCGGFLGGGESTATPGATQPGVSTPAPTPSPTPTATTAPTSTPYPDSFTSRTVRNESLGVTFDLFGDADALDSVLTADITGLRITRGAVLQCARTTPFVAISTNAPVEDVGVTMSYDDSQLPANASESELSVFVYNRTVDFYLEMETTVDTANDTASATDLRPGQTFTRETEDGTETLEPQLDGTRLDNAFVVMHSPTFYEAVETQEIPPQCQSDTATPTPTGSTPTASTATPTATQSTNGTAN